MDRIKCEAGVLLARINKNSSYKVAVNLINAYFCVNSLIYTYVAEAPRSKN